MPFTLRHFEIAEADHLIHNPIDEAKLDLLGRLLDLRPGQRMLDIACGSGEMLSRWARDHGITGTGVDLSDTFIASARERADALGVAGSTDFVKAEGAEYLGGTPEPYDIAACIGACWIGGGPIGTAKLLRPWLRDGGLLLIGEPYWTEGPPPAELLEPFGFAPDSSADLPTLLERFTEAGLDLVEMVLADGDGWDRYVARQWWTIDRWLRANPGHEMADGMREFRRYSQTGHFGWQRRYFGWGVFALREAA